MRITAEWRKAEADACPVAGQLENINHHIHEVIAFARDQNHRVSRHDTRGDIWRWMMSKSRQMIQGHKG